MFKYHFVLNIKKIVYWGGWMWLKDLAVNTLLYCLSFKKMPKYLPVKEFLLGISLLIKYWGCFFLLFQKKWWLNQIKQCQSKKMSLVVPLIHHMPFEQLELDNTITCHPIKFERPEVHGLALWLLLQSNQLLLDKRTFKMKHEFS